MFPFRPARNAYRIRVGDDPATLPVTLAASEERVVNTRAVREAGVVAPAGDQAALAGAEETRLARTTLLPDLKAGITEATPSKISQHK